MVACQTSFFFSFDNYDNYKFYTRNSKDSKRLERCISLTLFITKREVRQRYEQHYTLGVKNLVNIIFLLINFLGVRILKGLEIQTFWTINNYDIFKWRRDLYQEEKSTFEKTSHPVYDVGIHMYYMYLLLFSTLQFSNAIKFLFVFLLFFVLPLKTNAVSKIYNACRDPMQGLSQNNTLYIEVNTVHAHLERFYCEKRREKKSSLFYSSVDNELFVQDKNQTKN